MEPRLSNNQWMGLSFLLTMILRIPRFIGIFTIDGFYLIWEADLLISGELGRVMLHPLSFFGAYPYSPYPIGSVLLMAFFRIVSFKVLWLSILLFNIVLLAISTLSIWKFLDFFTDNSTSKFLGSILYTTIPFFLQYSYTNVSARTPFFAIYPLILLYQTRALYIGSRRDLLYSILLVIVSNLFHRMAMVILFLEIGIILLFILFKIGVITRLKERIDQGIQSRSLMTYFIFLFLFSYLTSIFIANVFNYYLIPFDLGINFLNYYQIVISQSLQKHGSLSILSIVSVVYLFAKNTKISGKWLISLLLQSPIWLLLPNIVYVTFLITPSLVILSLFCLELNDQSAFRKIMITVVMGQFLLLLVIQILFASRLISLILSIFIFSGILFQTSVKRFDPSRFKVLGLVVLIIFSNASMLDTNIEYSQTEIEESPGEFYTPEEAEIVEFLKQQKPATLWTYSQLLTARVATLSGWRIFTDLHSLTPILTEYYSEDDLRDNEIKSFFEWSENWVFEPGLNTSRSIHAAMLSSSLNDNNVSKILARFNVPFMVIHRSSDVAEQWPGLWVISILVSSIRGLGDLVFQTDNYLVYDVSAFHEIV